MKTIIKTALFAAILGLMGQNIMIYANGTITSILNEQDKAQQAAALENAKDKIIAILSKKELEALKKDESYKDSKAYWEKEKQLYEAQKNGYQNGKKKVRKEKKKLYSLVILPA